jgi:hypothetical protein
MTLSMHRIILTLFSCMAVFTAALSAAEAPDKSEVEALVRKLGDERFTIRQQADKELKEMGEAVAAQLGAFLDNPNPETRARVRGVLDYIASLSRELQWNDPENVENGKNRSTMRGGAVKLTFRNLTKKPVRIFWVETDGSRKAWRDELKPGATAVCARSYRGHVWLITDVEKKPLGFYKIDMDDPIIAVRESDWKN